MQSARFLYYNVFIRRRPLCLCCVKTVKKQTQLEGAGLCSARQKTLRLREDLRQIRMHLPVWL